MSNIKRCFLFFFCLLVLLSSFLFSASAEYPVFEFSMPEPVVDSYHGYIVVPYHNPTLNKDFATLYFWVITPVNVPDNDSVPSVTVDYLSLENDFSLMFGTGQSDCSWYVQIYQTTANDQANSAVYSLTSSGLVNYSSAVNFSITFGSDIQFYAPVLMGCSMLDASDTFPYPIDSYSIVWGDDAALYNQLIEANSKLSEILTEAQLTNEQAQTIIEILDDIYETNSAISSDLGDFIYIYWDQFINYDFNPSISSIITILQRILKLLTGPDEGFTESSSLSDEQEKYNDVEDELLNNEDGSNAQGSIDIDINENAMSYIWDLITRFLSANSKVFGLFISVLSLGIIALILNR